MRKLLILSIIFSLFACTENRKPVFSEESTANQHLLDSIAYELCTMYGLDQGIRDRKVWGEINKTTARNIDSLNFAKLVSIVQEFGYPNENILGDRYKAHSCVIMSSSAIMLHNPHKIIHDQALFDLFLDEVNKGNLSREFFATILDKYYWFKSRGEHVMYGSSFGIPCIDTKDETNRLRKEIGLKPLKDEEFKDCT